MKDVSVMIKVVLYLSMSVTHVPPADTHSLLYLYTGLTPGINITAVGLVDREQIVYYDSNIRKVIPTTEWIKQVGADDPDYWNRESVRMQNQQDQIYNIIQSLTHSHTQGNHVLQRMYGCKLGGDGTTEGYDQFGYDGENFISLNLNTRTWTAANDEAEKCIQQWEAAGDQAETSQSYLRVDCIHWLKQFVSYGRETLQRKVPPEVSLFQNHSSSPEVVCHATGFFPKAVMITWKKDGEDVHEKEVELRETLPNQDGSFQKRSILKVPAEELQKHTYTCVIQHSSLEKELVLPVRERRILRGGEADGGADGGAGGAADGVLIGIIIGVVALVGLVVVVVAVLIWKKRNWSLISGYDGAQHQTPECEDTEHAHKSTVTTGEPE